MTIAIFYTCADMLFSINLRKKSGSAVFQVKSKQTMGKSRNMQKKQILLHYFKKY